MTYSKLQKPWYSKDKFIINSIILHNVALVLSTISDSYAKMEN